MGISQQEWRARAHPPSRPFSECPTIPPGETPCYLRAPAITGGMGISQQEWRARAHPPSRPFSECPTIHPGLRKRYAVTVDLSRSSCHRLARVHGQAPPPGSKSAPVFETEICDFPRDPDRAARSAPLSKPRGPTRRRAIGFETEL